MYVEKEKRRTIRAARRVMNARNAKVQLDIINDTDNDVTADHARESVIQKQINMCY